MKIKMFTTAAYMKNFLTGVSTSLVACVYQESPYNVEIEVDVDRMRWEPAGYGEHPACYKVSRKFDN